MIDFTLIWDSLPSLLHGTITSLQITSIAAFMGLTLGSIFGILETSKSRLVSFVNGFR